jgi:hypothetical protein
MSEADLADFLEILQGLVREPSVVGTEDSFFRVLRRELEEVDVSIERYLGSPRRPRPRKNPESIVLSAHIDRHGLLCTGPNEFQYAAFIAGNQGELTGDSVSEQMMASIANRFTGQRVQAHLPYTGTYLGQGTISASSLCEARRNLLFEIQGLEFLQPGTPVSFLDRLRVSETHLSAQLDNVLSVALIIYLFRKGFTGTALFTAQEEAGKSWRYALSWLLREGLETKRLLVLDTSPYPTTEAADAQQLVLAGKGRDRFLRSSPSPRDRGTLPRPRHPHGLQGSLDRERESHPSQTHVARSHRARPSHRRFGGTFQRNDPADSDDRLPHRRRDRFALASVRAAIRLLSSY